jgi:SAM-dependent methyltransferase
MNTDFYRQFEDRHRGSRELILSRLQIYSPFISPLKDLDDAHQAIDLGCGRGEWLEFITRAGLDATGVDLDEQMLVACHERGLKTFNQDVISALKQLPENSQVLVSGFHLAEHLQFADLQLLVQEAFRVLKTGGLLILETPNPENIIVGSSNFYLDPSHHRPLPQQLLSFLPELYGFDRVKILRLQEMLDLNNAHFLTIHDVLGGVSPDYAVIAQKNHRQLGADFLAQAFNIESGISLSNVSQKYEKERATQIDSLNSQIQGQEQLIFALTTRLNTLEKILAPFMWANRQRRLLKQDGVLSRLKRFARKIIYWLLWPLNHAIRKHPKIHLAAINLCIKLGIYHWLFRLFKSTPSAANNLSYPLTTASEEEITKLLTSMPLKTQEFYKKISSALSQKEND